jgi:hypothetical protein
VRRTTTLAIAALLIAGCSSAPKTEATRLPTTTMIAVENTSTSTTSVRVEPSPATTTTAAQPATSTTAITATPALAVPMSREWMLVAQEIVKARKPSPPASARLYAYEASTYQGVISRTHKADEAGLAVVRVLSAVSPEDADMLAAKGAEFRVASTLSVGAALIVDQMIDRARTDGADAEATASKTPPTGPGKWVSRNGQVPLGVTAGSWKRWILDAKSTFEVPPPPAPGSPAMAEQIARTKQAATARDSRWVAAINYWGGALGTEAPAGIWQNHLWRRVADDSLAKDDEQYAQVQAVLAKAIADAFMETWKVKYTYWTARPDMLDPSVDLAMADPPFPGYVSGHSAVSATAAAVLGSLLPDSDGYWFRSAEEARDSRLYAGIHLSVDNEQGFLLGQRIGNAVVAAAFVSTVSHTFEYAQEELPLPTGPVEGGRGVLAAAIPPAVPTEGAPVTLGTLYKVSKPGMSKAFVVATGEKLPLGPGWQATALNKNSAWVAGSCASSPSTMLGDGYVVYADYANLVAYDITAGKFRRMSLGSQGVNYLVGVDDHHVALIRSSVQDYRNIYSIDPFAMVVDVADASYEYRKISGDQVLATEQHPGSWVVATGGRLAFSTRDLLNGTEQHPAPDPSGDISFVDNRGQAGVQVAGWRRAAAWAWDSRFAYMTARPTNDSSDTVPGVFDRQKRTWDWAFPTSPARAGGENNGNWFVTLGTLAA